MYLPTPPAAKKREYSPGKVDEKNHGALAAPLKSSAEQAPVPKGPANVAKVFKQLRKSRGHMTEDENDSDEIRPAPMRLEQGVKACASRKGGAAKQITAAAVERDSPEAFWEIQVAIAAFLRDGEQGRRSRRSESVSQPSPAPPSRVAP